MDARLQRRVQRYGWDKSADHYERYWARQLAPAQRRLLALADLRPGERVIDVACGTGLVSLPAAEAVGHDGEVTGTDISGEMVKLIGERAGAAGVAGRFERMDAEDLRFPDAAFDGALCALALMYLPDPEQALSEMNRVLKPGGRAVVAVWGERSRCGWASIFPIVEERVSSEVCPLFFRLGSGETLRKAMGDAGFTGVSVERMSATLRYASDDDACGAAFAGGPVAMAYSRFDEATRREAHQAYLASISSFKNGDGYRIPGEFVIARGEKG